MDEFDFIEQGPESPPLAYPGRLTIFRTGNKLELPAIIRELSTSGAAVELDLGYLRHLPDQMAENRVRIECQSPGGESLLLVGQVKHLQRRGMDNCVLAEVAFDDVSLPQKSEIQALINAPNKDHRLLWGLWEDLSAGREG